MADPSHLRRRSVRHLVDRALRHMRGLAALSTTALGRAVPGFAVLGFAVLGFALLAALMLPATSSAQTPYATPVTYAVQAGETLSQIAKRNGLTVDELMRVNGIPNADAIYVGQVLRFPLAGPPAGMKIHVVQPGEGLLQIARRYGVDVRAVMRANGIANPNGIVAGHELIIPSGQPSASLATPPPATPLAMLPATLVPAELQPPAEATPEPAPAQTHTVRSGETASEIAKRYGVKLADLLRYNGIANADMIRIGAELVIPPTAAPVAEPTPAPTPAAAPDAAPDATPDALEGAPGSPQPTEPAAFAQAGEVAALPPLPSGAEVAPLPERPATSLNREYTIVRGDTVPAIALRLGVDADGLRALNSLESDVRLVAGETLLLPATDRDLRVVTPEEEYVVQSGDSLSEIASTFGVTLAELMNANRMSNPNLVSVGERLTIPGRALDGDGPLQRVGPARTGFYFYTVQSGDTLSELAQTFGITKLALIKYNNLPDEATVYAGMELRVPFGAPEIPRRLPPVPISGSRFLISLSRQQCWVFAGREVEYAWNCSTGIEDRRTKTGNFAVQSKIEMAESNVWRLDMPYWLGIYDVGRVENGIHGLPISWATGKKIWTTLIGQPATFGCAMLGDENAKTLFDLAYIGMPVHIVQ